MQLSQPDVRFLESNSTAARIMRRMPRLMGSLSPSEMATRLDLSLQHVSLTMTTLERKGLLVSKKEGRTRTYELRDPNLEFELNPRSLDRVVAFEIFLDSASNRLEREWQRRFGEERRHYIGQPLHVGPPLFNLPATWDFREWKARAKTFTDRFVGVLVSDIDCIRANYEAVGKEALLFGYTIPNMRPPDAICVHVLKSVPPVSNVEYYANGRINHMRRRTLLLEAVAPDNGALVSPVFVNQVTDWIINSVRSFWGDSA
jgi:DNA-binding transcriptional ArsR family regulator